MVSERSASLAVEKDGNYENKYREKEQYYQILARRWARGSALCGERGDEKGPERGAEDLVGAKLLLSP